MKRCPLVDWLTPRIKFGEPWIWHLPDNLIPELPNGGVFIIVAPTEEEAMKLLDVPYEQRGEMTAIFKRVLTPPTPDPAESSSASA